MPSDEPNDKQEWIREALQQHEGALIRYATSLVGDVDRARDVVQDTFLKLWEVERSTVENHLVAWLFCVCRNRSLDVRRKEDRMTPLTDVLMETRSTEEAMPSEQAEKQEAIHRILALVKKLPQNQREVIRLKFQNELSYQEISEITRLSISHIGVLIHNGLKAIRHEMSVLEGEAL